MFWTPFMIISFSYIIRRRGKQTYYIFQNLSNIWFPFRNAVLIILNPDSSYHIDTFLHFDHASANVKENDPHNSNTLSLLSTKSRKEFNVMMSSCSNNLRPWPSALFRDSDCPAVGLQGDYIWWSEPGNWIQTYLPIPYPYLIISCNGERKPLQSMSAIQWSNTTYFI